jgi:outer membrane biosynthesis protein TonB
MRKRTTPKTEKAGKIHRERDPIPWRYCLLTLACGLILAVGFFFAARQHFSSIDFSIKNSKLRKQIDELEAEKRRILLAKEIALSPAEIKKAAKKLGFQEMTAGNIEVYRPVNIADKNKTAADKPKPGVSDKPSEIKKENKDDKKPEVKKENIDDKKAEKKEEKKVEKKADKKPSREEEKKTPASKDAKEKPKAPVVKK